MSREPAVPKFSPGAAVVTVCRASGRLPGATGTMSHFSLDRGEVLTVVAVLPAAEWGMPSWPRYELRDRNGRTLRLDEGHLAAADPGGERPATIPMTPLKPPAGLFGEGDG